MCVEARLEAEIKFFEGLQNEFECETSFQHAAKTFQFVSSQSLNAQSSSQFTSMVLRASKASS